MRRIVGRAATLGALAFVVACKDRTTQTASVATTTTNCLTSPAASTTLSQRLSVVGLGPITNRYTAEVTTLGQMAYTTTWGAEPRNGLVGDALNIWDVSANLPRLVDSIIVTSGVVNLGDVAVSDDGTLLMVPTENAPGRIVLYDLSDPVHPRELSRFNSTETQPGVHTAEFGRINGRLYAFLAVDPTISVAARLVILDLSNPSAPQSVYSVAIGQPYVHDTQLRDGILFLALWNEGLQIWDLGGGGLGGTPSAPKLIGSVKPVGGEVHNATWVYDPGSGAKRYLFTGEEGPGTVGSSSVGDVHVIDVCDLSNPREVAFYHVPGAGTHNFSADESTGVLYAAYYNGGVRALDVRGDLGTCTAQQKSSDGRCDLTLMGRELGVALTDQAQSVYVWGVEYRDGFVYASDMLNGLWKLKAIAR